MKTLRFRGQEYPKELWKGQKLADPISLAIIEARGDVPIPSHILVCAFDDKVVTYLSQSRFREFLDVNDSAFLYVHHPHDLFDLVEKYGGGRSAVFDLIDSKRLYSTWLLERLCDLAKTGDLKDGDGTRYSIEAIASRMNISIPIPAVQNVGSLFGKTTSNEGALNIAALKAIATHLLFDDLLSKVEAICRETGAEESLLLSHKTQLKAVLAARLTSERCLTIDQELNHKYDADLTTQIDQLKTRLKQHGYWPGDGAKKRYATVMQKIETNTGLRMPTKSNVNGKISYSESKDDFAGLFHIPFIKDYFEFKKLNDLLIKHVKPYAGLDVCRPKIEILTVSGRISMAEPALQTLPRRSTGNINPRELFIARPGHVFLISDFAGAELATLAQVCFDLFGFSRIKEALERGDDLHGITAAQFFQKKPESLTKEERQFGKPVNFGLPAGMSATRLVAYAWNDYGVRMTQEEAERIIDLCLATFPEIQLYLDRAKSMVRGGVGTVFIPRSGRVKADCRFTEFCNNPFQGLQADTTKTAWYELHKNGFPVVHQMHDELITEILDGDGAYMVEKREKQEEIIKSCAKQFCPDVKVSVKTHASKCWGRTC